MSARTRILFSMLLGGVLLVGVRAAQAQTSGGGSTGGGSTGGGTGGGSTGGGSTGGGTGAGIGTDAGIGTGANGNFLGTGLGTTFISGGYEPGALGHAGKAGNRSANANTTLFGRFYVNAYGLGLPQGGTGATATVAFGTPLYSTLYSGTGTTAGVSGGVGGVGGVGGAGRIGGTTGIGGAGSVGGVGSVTAGFTPMNTNAMINRRPASYSTSIAFKYRPTPQAEVQASLRRMLARSSDLAGNDSLEVLLDGQTYVLRGTVAEYQQSRLAENLLRLSPGVREVRNEIAIQETAPPPKPLNP
ncbi:MAG: BON domain-containing protein [Planctomycetia bacterium]|nr:BON domain-containing protein [Planctomycetia bacterium]